MIDLDFTLQFLPDNPAFAPRAIDRGETFYDFMVGARYTWAFSDRWSLTLRGDGSWGDTEGTWNASVLGQYRTGNGSWAFGYRYLDVDLESRRRHAERDARRPRDRLCLPLLRIPPCVRS